jgi:indolepyruvate decarboxylase
LRDLRRGRPQYGESGAASFAERVPILVISGGPGEEERKLGVLIHHQAKEIESQYRIR